MITLNDKVASVLARDERLLEVFVAASPAFEMLRSPLKRKTMARLVTISQAARIAGIEASVLLARLNGAFPGDEAAAPPPAAEEPSRAAAAQPAQVAPPGLLETPGERLTDLDVREDLLAGREPLRRILESVKALPGGNVLRLRATFEPVPLYAALGRQGFGHFTERFAADDWRVWFFKDAGAASIQSAAQAASLAKAPDPVDGDVVVLDVRGLEPPEPMVRTLEAAAALPRGKTLVQINQRVPQFLLPKLAERGFIYEIREQSQDLVRIFIQHKQP